MSEYRIGYIAGVISLLSALIFIYILVVVYTENTLRPIVCEPATLVPETKPKKTTRKKK